jgi:hypothetical protein
MTPHNDTPPEHGKDSGLVLQDAGRGGWCGSADRDLVLVGTVKKRWNSAP